MCLFLYAVGGINKQTNNHYYNSHSKTSTTKKIYIYEQTMLHKFPTSAIIKNKQKKYKKKLIKKLKYFMTMLKIIAFHCLFFLAYNNNTINLLIKNLL